MSSGPSSGWFTRLRRCWRAHPFDRGAWPAITSGPVSQPGRTFEWASGVRLVYNPALLQLAEGTKAFLLRVAGSRYRSCDSRRPNSGLHLFDAKFRVHGLADVGFAGSDRDGDDEKVGERAGSFKRADIYKMHAYRDAIPDARSVWILYPGGEFQFFGIGGAVVRLATKQFLRPRGCPKRCRGSGRFRLLRWLGTRRRGGWEGRSGVMGCWRETLRRAVGGGGGMSTTPYIW